MARKILYAGMAIMLVQGVLFTNSGFCFDNAHLQKLNRANKCEKCDLSYANLANLDMYGGQGSRTI